MFEIREGKFFNNNQPTHIYSGAIHYFRVLPEYWEDRLKKLKLCGLNTVETYVAWNLHEPQPNQFNFQGIMNIRKFLLTATKLGLNVIVRPGPYICAEWDFGGLPAWLLADKNINIRCNDEKFLAYVKNFYKALFSQIKDLQSSQGGNIIAMQIENEYGSYGNDKVYLKAIRQIMDDCGCEVLKFTSDGGCNRMLSAGTLSDEYKTLNFGSGAKNAFKALDRFEGNKPKMCMEFWCGWFDHWGEKHHTRKPKAVLKEVQDFLDQDANFNLYMFHGGTNFGFTAGANHSFKYQPTTTSYDYNAPLNEYGDYTPLYHSIRELLHKKTGEPMQELPPSPKLQNIGEVKLTNKTSLFDNLDNIGIKHYSPAPLSMECYQQNFGMIMYKTRLPGKYGTGTLEVNNLRDIGYLYIDNKYKTSLGYTKGNIISKITKRHLALLTNLEENTEISLLVDCLGRVNYGKRLTDAKGISALTIENQLLFDYEVTSLPLDNLEKLDFSKNSSTYPMFFKGEFFTNSNDECFVDLSNFTRGVVYVNGFNLGRYWKKGPQKTLYLPGAILLKDKPNEVIILEMEKSTSASINISDKHNLG